MAIQRSSSELFPGLVSLVILALIGPTANAQLTIIPTYDSTITSDPNSLTIQATINTAIQEYQTRFTTAAPTTVNLTFREMTSGLGQSSTFITTIPYSTYRSALVSHATTTADTTALNSLPTGSSVTINGHQFTDITITTANARAIGINASVASDSTISLNTSLMNLTRPPGNTSKYDLKAVVQHEIDEALGMGSNLDFASGSGPVTTGNLTPMDLFRYTSTGTRSFTRSTSAQSFFSINGTTQLAQFNQDSTGDHGDWFSPGGQTPQVQDAFGTPGATPDLGVELTALDVIGYDLVVPVPEPTTVLAVATAGLGLGGAIRRRRVRA